jgi:hypothetical protein
MFGLDNKSLAIGLALGFFVGPMVVGKIRSVVGK